MSIKVKKSKNWIFLLAMILTLGIFGIAGWADARSSYLTQYNTYFGTSQGCGLCHVDPGGGGTLNATGNAFGSAHNYAAIKPTDPTSPTVTITTPTSSPTYSASSSSLSIGGTASDNFTGPFGVTQVSWSNSLGGSGTASGTTSWTATVSLSSGSNVITVTARDEAGNTGTDTLTVTYAAASVLTTIAVTPASASITQGSTQQFSAEARDQNGNPMSPQPTFTWTSSNTAVASVNSSGLATGVAAGGPVTITAASGTISGTASLTVTASAPVLTSITIDPTTASIAVGATRQFTAAARDQNGNPMSPQPTFTWTSSNTAVASVNSSGLATGVAAGGPVTITAASGTIKGTASITISTPTPGTPDMTIWVGQWLKITSRYNGYLSQSSKLNAKRASVVGYIKFRSWNPDQNVLQADLYQYDSEISEWVSDALPIQYLAGSKLDFLGLSQVTGNFTSGFTARIQGKEKGGVLERATFKTMGGFYVEAIGESESGSESGSEASEHNAGGLSMNGTLIPESNVPEAILH